MPEVEDYARELRGFSAVGGVSALGAGRVYGEAGAEPIHAKTAYVTPGFFPAIGTPARLGRTIAAAEHADGANPVVVLGDGFWRRQLGADPRVVGRAIRLGGEPFTDVGVMPPDFAFPSRDVAAWMPTGVLPGQAILEVAPMRDKLAAAASTPRFFTVLVRIFGGLALTLAAVGLYGIGSYVVRQREREIGVRVALGAAPGAVVGLMLRRGMAPVLVGLAVGLPAALLATRLRRSLLYEVNASDPPTLVAVAALLAEVAHLASWLPSRRAARVDPTVTLRAE